MRPIVEKNPGFIAVERFENLQKSGWYLSFSQWRDELALSQWRCQPDHYGAQVCGRSLVLQDYRLRVATQQNGKLNLASRAEHEQIAIFIGDFMAIKGALQVAVRKSEELQLFRGVIDPQRGIGMVNKISTQIEFASNPQFEIRHFEVCRDYGMFDRAEAPQQFA